jgi:hypothetical protein
VDVVIVQFYFFALINDRNYLSAMLIRQFLSAMPSLMNCLLLDHLPKVVESLKSMKSKKKSKVALGRLGSTKPEGNSQYMTTNMAGGLLIKGAADGTSVHGQKATVSESGLQFR